MTKHPAGFLEGKGKGTVNKGYEVETLKGMFSHLQTEHPNRYKEIIGQVIFSICPGKTIGALAVKVKQCQVVISHEN